ncbi:hypothetical protein ACFL23_01440 [Patescibacteria group bacterium]
MNQLETWRSVITSSFQNLWIKGINFSPNVISAIIVLIIGLIVAKILSRFVTQTLRYLYLDKAADSLGIKEKMQKIGIKIDISKIAGLVVKWFFIIVFLVAAADILRFTQITDFLNKVLLYIPNVIIAVVILMLGIIFANFIYGMVKASVHVTQLGAAEFIASVAKWAILIFTVMAVLVQLRIAAELVETLFKGFVAMIAIAGGISFGLGGKEKAKKAIDKLMEKK